MVNKKKSKKGIKIKCEGTQYVDFHKLNEFQEDIKTITREDLDKLKESIITRGYIQPGFVWKHNKKLWILDMHQRKKALTELEKEGWYIPNIPVVEIFAKTVKEAKDAVLVYTAQHGKLDESKLKVYIQKYQINLKTLVIRNEPLKIELQQNKETKQDDAISEDVKPITKMGDLWELGEHRVLCGDSTEENDVEKLMNGEKGDMVFTDPPYGIDLDTLNKKRKCTNDFAKAKKVKSGRNYKQVQGDKYFDPKLIEIIFEKFFYCKEIFLWGADYYIKYIKADKKNSWFVWDKRIEKNFDKMIGNTFELCWGKNKHKREIIRIKWIFIFGTEKEFDKKRHHPTQKPVELSCWFIEKFSKKMEMIIDLYLGSGSTLIACEKTGRICYGMEIEPNYCDIIVKRYIDWCQKNNRPVLVKRNGKLFDINKFNIPAKQGVSRE